MLRSLANSTDNATEVFECHLDCSTLNRNPCVSSNICGSCASGFSGESIGNTLCTGFSVMLLMIIGTAALFLGCFLFLYCSRDRGYIRFPFVGEFGRGTHRAHLEDSFVEDEWSCQVCYHENHPEKDVCVMCGTPDIESKSPSFSSGKYRRASHELSPTARRRSFCIRRLNNIALNIRQEGARRRHMWKRRRCSDGKLRWIQADPKAVALNPLARGTLISSKVVTTIPELPKSRTLQFDDDEDIEYNLASVRSTGYVRVEENGTTSWNEAHTASLNDSMYESRMFGTSIVDIETVAALPFKDKTKWFLSTAQQAIPLPSKGHLLLNVRREHILEDTMTQLLNLPSLLLRERLRVEFTDEPGIDAGGLVREWSLLPTRVDQVSYWINPASEVLNPKHLEYFRFFGRFMGKLLLEGHILTTHLALPLLKHVLSIPISKSDLMFLDEDIYKSYIWIMNNSNVESLGLDFSLYGKELKPGGFSIELTDENKQEYLALVLRYYMLDSIDPQLSALMDGLEEVLSLSMLQIFDYQELELLLCGIPDIDIHDWERHTNVRYIVYNDESTVEKQLLVWFWEVVESFSNAERARLLQYTTGTSRLPVEGFKALTSYDGQIKWFSIQILQRDNLTTGLYPRSHTCFNRLDLPLYLSKEELYKYLSLVINMELTGFTTQ